MNLGSSKIKHCSCGSFPRFVVLLRVLLCKHVYAVWDKMHKHFNSQIKARVHRFRYELKMSKKGNGSILEYVLRICTIVNPLLVIGDMFIMIIYGKWDPMNIYNVDALLYVQGAQLYKYRQELATPSATANVAEF